MKNKIEIYFLYKLFKIFKIAFIIIYFNFNI